MRKILCCSLVVFLLAFNREAHTQEGLPWQGGPPSVELMKLLKELNQQYGPDTVTLVSWLLDAATRSGSVLTASVKVNGTETRENRQFLVFQVDTGIIFNTQTIDQNGRLTALWEQILAKALTRLETARFPADGVMVDLLYHSKSFPETDDITDHIDEPGPVEEAKFYFRTDPLRAFLNKELSPQALLTRSHILVNDVPVTITLPAGTGHTNISSPEPGGG